MSDKTDDRIRSAIRAQRAVGLWGDNWDNHAVARGTLHDELDTTNSDRPIYGLDETTRDILIAHARQDAAHAVCNTNSLLKRVHSLTRVVYALIAIVLLVVAVLVLGWLPIRAHP